MVLIIGVVCVGLLTFWIIFNIKECQKYLQWGQKAEHKRQYACACFHYTTAIMCSGLHPFFKKAQVQEKIINLWRSHGPFRQSDIGDCYMEYWQGDDSISIFNEMRRIVS